MTFLPSNIDAAQSNAGAIVYSRTNGNTTDTLTLTRPGTSGPITYTYVGAAFWQRTVQVNANQVNGAINAVAYGIPTPNSALARTGQATFVVDLIGARTISNNVSPIAGSGTMLVDFASGSIVTTGRVTSGGVQGGSPGSVFRGDAQLASDANAFSGTFTLEDFGRFNGAMAGRFFGPNAEEVGAALRATYTTDLFVGTLTGRRGAAVPANTQFNDNSMNSMMPVLDNSELFRADGATIITTLAGSSGSNNAGQSFSNGSRSADGLNIFYDSVNRSYTVIASDRSQSFFPPDFRVSLATTTESLGPGGRNLSVTIPAPSLTLTYTRAGSWALQEGLGSASRYRLQKFVYGIVTPDSDLPRTGTANFRLILNGTFADSDFPNLINVEGTGVLEANLATGALRGLGTLGYREDYTISGRAAATPSGNFDFTAALASNANRFNGTINLSGIGSYSGALAGRFFGPAAQEVGASFSVSDGGTGIGAGTIVGVRDATAQLPAAVAPLTSLSGPTALTSRAAIVGSAANAGQITAVSFDPVANRYVLSFRDTGLEGAPTVDLTLDSTTRDAAGSSTTQAVHAGTFRGSPYVATLSVPGAADAPIALTYAGFARIDYNVPMFRTRYFAHYGLATPSQTMPRTGSATYTGGIIGHGFSTRQSGAGTSTEYALGGTGTLNANFADSSIGVVLAITGAEVGGTTVRDFGTFNFIGSISGNGFSAGGNRDGLSGIFYGPNADEFAALFGITRFIPIPDTTDSNRIELDGIFAGQRRP